KEKGIDVASLISMIKNDSGKAKDAPFLPKKVIDEIEYIKNLNIDFNNIDESDPIFTFRI
ncbi:MAG: hypothetical protein LUC91_11600, partial [Prevotella sp.]|nr:hypothetical protein [Prevotella sp.]